jgi:MFS family permease
VAGFLRKLVVDTGPLRHREYRLLWSANVVTSIGSQLTAVAVPKQLYDDTGSSIWIGVSGAVALIPLVVFALWGGAVADVVDRRRLLLVTNSGIALTSLLLWAQAAAGLHSVALLLVLMAVQQAFFGMNQPAESSAIPRLVPISELPAANALNATVMQFGAVVGPLLAGVLIPVVGIAPLYLADTVGLAIAVAAVSRLPALPRLATETVGAGIKEIAAGFRYLATRSALLVSYLADIIAMVFGMPRALFPELAQRSFGPASGQGLSLGILYAALPVGAVLGGLLSGPLSRARRQGLFVIIAVCAWGLAMVGFGLSESLWLAAFFLALGGAADLFSMIWRSSILQAAAGDEMRGRMQGVFTVVVAGGPRIADLLHGTIGAAIGTRVTITAGGVLVVAAMITVGLAAPGFTRYERPPDEDPGRDLR